MSQEAPGNFPVGQLMQRYGLAKSGIYKRMNGLGIRPHRIGIRAYITSSQLELLDELHQFIQGRGTLPEFVDQRKLRAAESGCVANLSNSSVSQAASASVVHVLAVEPTPLDYFECLERAAQKGWHLSTSEIASLLRVSVDLIQEAGESFSEAGFAFNRVGQRMIGELCWKVSKLEQ